MAPPSETAQACILAQSAVVAQLVLHPLAATHAKGAQSTRVPGMQVPLEQVDGGRYRSWPSHIAWPHTVPSAIGLQVPCLPGTAHERQLGHIADPQQNPSTQLPLRHSPGTVHALPVGFRLVHEYPRHRKPVAQSPSVVHVVLHAFVPHR